MQRMLILTLILCLFIPIVSADFDINQFDKFDIFQNLKTNHDKGIASFDFYNPLDYNLSVNQLEFSFIEKCGKVNDIIVYEKGFCNKIDLVPTYDELESCFDPQNGTKPICTIELVNETYIEQQSQYACDIPTSYINPGISTLYIDAEIQYSNCNGKMGYEIDWIPEITIHGKTFDRPEWAWWNATFSYCRNIEVTGADELLTDYPLWIKITNTTDFQSDGFGVSFVNSSCREDGSALNHEIDTFIINQASYFVKIPELKTTAFNISVYFEPTDNTDYSNENVVWTNDYLSVWHHTNLSDSVGGASATVSGAAPSGTAMVGRSYELNSNGQYINLGAENLGGDITICQWIKPETAGENDGGRPFSTVGIVTSTQITPDKIRGTGNDFGGGTFLDNTNLVYNDWAHVCLIRNDTDGSGSLWVNNVQINGTLGQLGGSNTIYAGNRAATDRTMDGFIDETYIIDGIKSNSWVSYSYNIVENQGSYITFGNTEIGNEGPELDITFTKAAFFNNENVITNVQISDLELDQLNYNITWKVNGATNSLIELLNQTPPINLNYSLSNTEFEAGDNVSFNVRVTDLQETIEKEINTAIELSTTSGSGTTIDLDRLNNNIEYIFMFFIVVGLFAIGYITRIDVIKFFAGLSCLFLGFILINISVGIGLIVILFSGYTLISVWMDE